MLHTMMCPDIIFEGTYQSQFCIALHCIVLHEAMYCTKMLLTKHHNDSDDIDEGRCWTGVDTWHECTAPTLKGDLFFLNGDLMGTLF